MEICGTKVFTGEDISAAMDQIVAENRPFFDLLELLGPVTVSLITSRRIEGDDTTELVSSCLLVKTINTFEAIIRLCRAGFVSDAKALVRSLLEAVVIMRFIEVDKNNVKVYLDASKHERVKRLRNILSHPEYFEGLIKENDIERLKQLRHEIAAEIDTNKIAKKNIREWAETAGMLESYIIAYDLFSEDVHIDPLALERYVIRDESDIVTKIDVRPVDLQDVRHVLFSCFDLFVMALSSYTKIRGLDQTGINNLLLQRSKFGPPLI